METEQTFGEVEPKSLQPDWKNAPTVMQLHSDYKQASSDQQVHMSNIKDWRDALNMEGKYAPKARKGKSSVAPKVIRKAVEWRVPSLSEPFLSTPDLFNVRGVTHLDVQSAKQNQLVLNYQFNTQINKRKFIDDTVRACCEDGTVFFRTGWEYESYTEEATRPVYRYDRADAATMQTYAQLAQLEANSPMSLDTLNPALIEGYKRSRSSSFPVVAVQVGTETYEKEVVVANRPTAEVCIADNLVVDPTCNGDIDNAMFVIYSYETNKAELQAKGFENLELVQFKGSTPSAHGEHESNDASGFTFSDATRNKIVAHEYWGYWDIHDDGNLEPIVATYIDGIMVQLEENPFPDGQLPFVAVPYNHVVGSIYGKTDADLMIDNQKVIGAVTRGMVDLMASSANSQQGVRKGFLDAVNKRRFANGQHYEFNDAGNPAEAVYLHKFAEIPVSAYNMLQMQNNEAESMSGVKAYASGIGGDALGSTATGVRGALDAASKRELAILRRIADGIVKVGRRIVAMNSQFLSEEEVVRVTDENYVKVKRDDLAGNFDLELSISTAEEDAQKAQELAFMVQTVGNSVEPTITYGLMADIADLRKMPDTAKRLRDYKPQPDPLVQQKAQLEIQLLQAQVQETLSKIPQNQMAAIEKQAKAGNLNADTDLKKLDYLEEESGVNHARDIEKMEVQSQGNARHEILKAALAEDDKQTTGEQA